MSKSRVARIDPGLEDMIALELCDKMVHLLFPDDVQMSTRGGPYDRPWPRGFHPYVCAWSHRER